MNDIESKSIHLIRRAIGTKATDIHFIPRRKTVLIRLRVNQRVYKLDEIPKSIAEKMISHFKFSADMDIGERRRPQSGSMEVIIDGNTYSLRMSTLPTPYNESLAIRLLPQVKPLTLEDLPLFPQAILKLSSFIKLSSGLVILNGPTGAGKSTTLYALLHAASKNALRQIISIEDPIEQKTDEFIQVEVNEKAKISYEEGLKSILRHDPDVIMIGEIRDEKTAKLAIRAALTGHLVFTTIHANDSIGAIYRLLDLGIPIIDLAQTIKAVISQRLVYKSCIFCGDSCSVHCPKVRRRSYAIFEILSDRPLVSQFSLLKGETSNVPPFRTLKQELNKAYALGFVSPVAYDRWMGDPYETR